MSDERIVSKKKDRKGENNSFYGRKHRPESMRRMVANHPRLGKKGPESMAWKGGNWQWCVRQVKERDNNTCQDCGLDEKGILVVDHIRPKSIFPELMLVLENLVLLCPNCHARKTLRDIAQYKITTVNRKPRKI